MKKLFYCLGLAALVMGTTACGSDKDNDFDKNKLATPVLATTNVGATVATVTWAAVENANEYAFQLNGNETLVTSNTSVTFEELTPNTEYTVKVQARRPGSEFFENSDWAEIKFTTTEQGENPAGGARIATFADDWDMWYYEWDGDKVKRIYRLNGDGGLDREWVFAYDGNNITVTGKNNYKMTLNEMGMVSVFEKVDDNETYTYTYDENGYMTEAKKNGEVCSEMTIENNNMVLWTRLSGGDWQKKDQTFGTELNVAGIHTVYSEKAGASRWLVETGLFGKGSQYLCLTSKWQHSETSADYSYEFDAQGRVLNEIKNYGGEIENFFFTYTE